MRRISFLPFLLLFLISFLIDLYTFQGVKILSLELVSELRPVVFYTFWIFSIGLIASLFAGFFTLYPKREFKPLFNLIVNFFLTFLITKLVFIMVLFAEDCFRVLAGIFSGYPARSVHVSQAALVLAAIPFFAFLFGVTKGKYHYKIHRVQLVLKDLPKAFNGFTITQISDIHSGSFDNKKGVKRGVDLINAQGSDLFVFTGDLVNNQATEIEPWIDIFKTINANYGKFSILGNHDYGDYIHWASAEEKIQNLDRLKVNHQKLGFKLLLDEHVKIEKDGEAITLLGVENWGLGFGQRGNLSKALYGVDRNAIKILLSHDPSHWDAEIKKRTEHIHLTLSGHTHGMQFGIELFGLKWSPVKYRYKNWAGLFEEAGRYLYVNRGFGFLGFSGRVGIWPEITVIEFKKA